MHLLDFRGEECPGPLVKTVRELSKMDKNTKLVVLTSSKMCVDVIVETVKAFSIGSIEVIVRGGYFEIHIVRM
ncbi:MAG: sulfurtransferase TusA family protein [Ignisphaera sp.]